MKPRKAKNEKTKKLNQGETEGVQMNATVKKDNIFLMGTILVAAAVILTALSGIF